MNLSIILLSGAVAVVVGLGFLALILALALRRVVPTDMVHIVQSGRKTTSFGKGQAAGNVYYEIPSFVPVWGVLVSKFAISNFKVDLKNYDAYDQKRVPFQVDVVAFFSIFDSDKAAQRVSSFTELHAQLSEILRGAVRKVLAEHPLEEILGMRSELGTIFTDQVDRELVEGWGVKTVKSIEFMDMRDTGQSTVIHDIQAKDQARISMESRLAIAENSRIAEIAEVEAQQQVDIKRQEAIQVVGQRTAEQDKAVGIAKEQAQQEVLSQAEITAQREMAVKQVEEVRAAEIARDVAQIKAEQDKVVTVINADAEKQRQIVEAEGQKQRTETISIGDLTAAKNEAEGIRAKGEAEGRAKEAINLADVAPQIQLAKEVGENKPYQEYLQNIEQIKASATIGVAQAEALKAADIKVIANGGDVAAGFGSIGELLSPKGGTSLAAWLTGIAQTPEGAALLERAGLSVSSTPAPAKDGKPGPTARGRA